MTVRNRKFDVTRQVCQASGRQVHNRRRVLYSLLNYLYDRAAIRI